MLSCQQTKTAIPDKLHIIFSVATPRSINHMSGALSLEVHVLLLGEPIKETIKCISGPVSTSSVCVVSKHSILEGCHFILALIALLQLGFSYRAVQLGGAVRRD